MKPLRPNRRAWFYIAFGIFAYALFLLAMLPAAWLSWGLARASDGAVALVAPSGTVWHGQGELQVGANPPLAKIEWRVNPLWLAAGQLAIGVRAGGTGAEARADLYLRPRTRLVVENLDAAFPASLTSLVYAPALFFAPTGKLSLATERLALDHTGLSGDAKVSWQNAGGRFTGAASLGDYRIDLQGRGETADIRLSTVRGSLELTGGGQWRVTGDGELRFSGFARPTADAQQLEPLLAALGRDQGGGRRPLSFVSRVPLVQMLGM